MMGTETESVIDTTGVEVARSNGTVGGGALVPHRETPLASHDPHRLELLERVGFITPIAEPAALREAFAIQQQVYAAILDPDLDYIYTVTFRMGNKPLLTQDRAYAQKMAEENDGIVAAKPKKNGVTKLARALGITARRTKSAGLPDDPRAQYAYVEYEATHAGTGRAEVGIGWCDRQERSQNHHILATADTRAYVRAVLRLAGFGDVGADDLVAGASEGDNLPAYVPDSRGMREVTEVPPMDDVHVVAAARAWAEVMATGELAPEAQQVSQHARELRARARRGDSKAARQLAVQGYAWRGLAQDALGVEPFESGQSPVSPEEIRASNEARKQAEDTAVAGVTEAATAVAPKATTPIEERRGWDLSAKGSDKDDTAPQAQAPVPGKETPVATKATEAEVSDAAVSVSDAANRIPQPDLSCEAVTQKQAMMVSTAIKDMFGGDKTKALAWMRSNLHVQTSIDLRANQYEIALKVIAEEAAARAKATA